MSAEDTLRRLEQRAKASRYTGWVIVTLVVIGALLGAATLIHRDGVSEGRALEQHANLLVALQNNANQLRADRRRADSVKHTDSVSSGLAAANRRAAAVHRPTVDRAASAVTVSGQVGDSLVVVKRPATGTDDSLRVDSLTTLPLPVATFIREAKVQLALDTLALHADSVAMREKDAHVGALELEVTDLVARDSLHVDYEKQQAREAKADRRRAYWRGVKTGVVGVVVVVGTLAIVL